MTALQKFICLNTFLVISVSLSIGFTTTTAYAGFEWVPQKDTAPQKAAVPVEPVLTLEPTQKNSITPAFVDDVILPLPSEEELTEPFMPFPAAAQEAKAPEAVIEITADKGMNDPVRVVVMPQEEPNSGIILNAETVDTPLPPLLEETQETVIEDPKLLAKPPIDRQNMHIIMPQDAPESAIRQTHNTTEISSFPDENNLSQSLNTPMPSVDDAPIDVSKGIPDTRVMPIPASQNNIPAFEEAVGFASDVPLALALREVAPADYAFSFREGVNPGFRVSWNGGKPWNIVIEEMVAPLGYKVYIINKTIIIAPEKVVYAPEAVQNSNMIDMPNLVEPAAGVEGSQDEIIEIATPALTSEEQAIIVPINREREIKRINVVDPGAQIQGQPSAVTALLDEDSIEQPAIEVASASESIINVPVASSSKMIFWTAEEGASLKETLQKWSDAAGADLVWEATHDFQLSSDIEIQGNFEKAVDLLLKHGVQNQDAGLTHSYVATSNDAKIKIIIDNKA